MVSTNVLRYGNPDPLPEQTPLRAGALSLTFENGDLRNICLGEHEIINRIYVAVRDGNWGTIIPKITIMRMDVTPQSFIIELDVEHRRDEIDFTWRGRITGSKDSAITFTMQGEAHSTFWRNRIGFCVLYPVWKAEKEVHIQHVDGKDSRGYFPIFIAPQHHVNGRPAPVFPFADMRELTFQVGDSTQVTTRFEGDVFEMEDQRNWTDASYKTYGTPQRIPAPVEVQAGTRIEQTITISLSGNSSETSAIEETSVVQIKQKNLSVHQLPHTGLGVASHNQPLSTKEIERLQALNLSYLRVDLHLADADYPNKLRYASDHAKVLDVSLEVALLFRHEDELSALIHALQDVQPRIGRWIIFDEKGTSSPTNHLWLARYHLHDYNPLAWFGGGSNANFTEANRNRPSADLIDFIAYSTNPQVHAFDNTSIMETAATHGWTVSTARHFSNKSVIVGPISLKQRLNPVTTGLDNTLPSDQLPKQVDPRQMSLLCAAWTMAVLKYLGENIAIFASFFETTGWLGVMETSAGSSLPDKFPSLPGGVFPVYHVLADIGEFTEGAIITSRSSSPMRVDSLMLRKDNRECVLLANMTNEPQRVTIDFPGYRGTLRMLDETNAEFAMREPEAYRAQAGTSLDTLECTLLPYAVARIDLIPG